VPFANAAVSALLRSPAHRVLSGSTDLVRFVGRRSGRTITTPTQYASMGEDLVMLAARPDTKQWWRNFTSSRDLDVLLRGHWRPMTAEAVIGADDPDRARSLMDVYCARFPRAAKALGEGTPIEQARRTVFVVCRPRTVQS
jgi:hypothetical protein